MSFGKADERERGEEGKREGGGEIERKREREIHAGQPRSFTIFIEINLSYLKTFPAQRPWLTV